MTGQGLTEAGLARMDRALADAVAQQQVPAAVVAVQSGDVRHVRSAGVLSVGGPAVRDDSLFRITSMTKPMTAAVVLGLIEDGLFRFDEPVETFLPELADRRVLRRPDGPLEDTVRAERGITVRDLLTYTWGFGMQGAMFASAPPWPVWVAGEALGTFGPPRPDLLPDPDTFLAGLGELPLVVQPGTTWLYQSGSQVLAALVARAVGRPFDVVLRERLLDPLGMADTAFWTADTARLATVYDRVDGGWTVVDPPDGQWSRPPAFPDGAAGLVSTAADVLRFGRMMLRGGAGVLRPEMVAEMTVDRLTEQQRSNPWGGVDLLGGRGWGYGVSVLADGSYSWDGGYGTAWTNVPAADLTVVTLTQRVWGAQGGPFVCGAVLDAAREAVA